MGIPVAGPKWLERTAMALVATCKLSRSIGIQRCSRPWRLEPHEMLARPQLAHHTAKSLSISRLVSSARAGGWNRIVVETKDLDATLAKVVAAGGKPRSKPIKGLGGRQVLVDDPSGNAVEVFEARGA